MDKKNIILFVISLMLIGNNFYKAQTCFNSTTTSINTPNYAVNTPLNTSTTSAVNLNGLANGLFNFSATLTGATSTWATDATLGGVRIKNDLAGVGAYIQLSPYNVVNGSTRTATYTLDFTSALTSFSFVSGGLDGSDAYEITAFNGAAIVPLTTGNVSVTSTSGWIVSSITNGVKVQGDGNPPNPSTFKTTINSQITKVVIRSYQGNAMANQMVTTYISDFQFCTVPDNDNDGIFDKDDLDDDNDGISDIDEGGPICVNTTNRTFNTVPYAFNTPFNSTITQTPVDVNNLANNSFSFKASLVGPTPRWGATAGSGTLASAGGVQIKNNFPLVGDYIYFQPVNTQTQNVGAFANILNQYAKYEISFLQPMNGFSFVSAGLNSNDTFEIYAYNGSTPIPLNPSNLSGFSPPNTAANWTVYDLGDGLKVVGLSGTGGTVVNANYFTTSISGNITRLEIRSYKNQTNANSSTVTAGITSLIYCTDGPFRDTDGDGTPDYLDLDADGDGCPDAIEGDENVKVTHLGSNGAINVGANGTGTLEVNANGVPKLVNGATANASGAGSTAAGIADIGNDEGQGVGTSIDKAVSACFIDAVKDINQTPAGVSVSGNVLTNDETGGGLTVQSATYLNASGVVTTLPLGTATNVYNASGVLAGSMTLNSDGTYTFVPAAGFTGNVPVNYTAVNAVGSTDSTTLEITVIPKTNPSLNDAPIAQNDTAATEAGTSVTSNALSNDSDPDGNTLTIIAATQGSTTITLGSATQVAGVDANGNAVANAGSLTLNANGSYTFVPAAGFVGTVNPINYTISDGNGGTDTAVIDITVYPNVAGSNNIYANDDANSAPKGTTMTGNISTNDTDPEGNTKTVSGATAYVNGTGTGTAITIGTATAIPGVGTLTLNANGTYTFVPNATYVGTTVVPYTICDNGSPQACDTATLYLTTLDVITTIDAVNDINQVPQGVTATGSVLTNDESSAGGGAITVQSATYLNASGVVTNLPLGTATNVYDASGVLAGSMTLNSDGTYSFVPAAGYVGTVPVNYVAVNAAGNTDPATLSIEVIKTPTSGNDKPIAQNDTAYTEAGTNVSSNVLANDSDPDGNTLTVTSAMQGSTTITLGTATQVAGVDANGNAVANAGSLTLNANGTYTFVPAAGFTGTVNPMPYTISDGNGGTDTAILNITVLPNLGNETFANDDANTGTQNGSTTIQMTGNVKNNDTDPEGNTQTVTSATVNGNSLTIGTATAISGVGTLTLNSDGTYTFVPNINYTGTTSVIYTICDNGSPQSCDTATLYLTVLATTACYQPAVTSGTVLNTNHGITALGRAGADNGNWPMVRKGAWTALEAKTKGFVPNRLTNSQISAIPAGNLVEGMMVYNIDQDCLQINTDGTASGWKCFNTPACP